MKTLPRAAKVDPQRHLKDAVEHYSEGFTKAQVLSLCKTRHDLEQMAKTAYAGSRGPVAGKHYTAGYREAMSMAWDAIVSELCKPGQPFETLSKKYSAHGQLYYASLYLGYLEEAIKENLW